MKIKEEYILKEVAGNFIVVAVGNVALDFNGVITLNETGAFLWKQLKKETTEVELTEALMNEYEIDKDSANKDVSRFIDKLKEADILE